MICSTDPSKFESSKLLETVESLLNIRRAPPPVSYGSTPGGGGGVRGGIGGVVIE